MQRCHGFLSSLFGLLLRFRALHFLVFFLMPHVV